MTGNLRTFAVGAALALAFQGGAAKAEISPDPVFSPAYFWMWNAKLEVPALLAQLEDMHAHGLRNVCIHPFPKGFRMGMFSSEMSPDYLTDGYMKAFAAVVRRAGELGMHAYLYDEGGWPSGGACGLVAASAPDGKFCPRVAKIGADGKAEIVTMPCAGIPPYPSIIEKGTTARFLELTHDAYAAAFPEAIGKTVKVAFTDEPQGSRLSRGVSIGWTSDFAEEFKRRKGYDLLPSVPELIRRSDETDDRLARLRIDYHDVMGDLFVERFLLPIRDWCRARGMQSGGHLNGEDRPERTAHYGHGNLLRSLRAMDVPGVDAIWRQLFPDAPGREATTLPFPRYAASAMHQQGGRYALAELFGIYGDSPSPAQIKWLVDYHLVRGVNSLVFGYFSMSNAHQWRLLFGPHSGPVVPYWDMEGHLFKYIWRTAEFMSRGRPGAEIAVLYDVRGFWAGGADCETAARNHYAVAQALDRLNCDYDFCDDESIARAEIVPGGRMRIGKMEYGTVVLPTKKWMLEEAKAKLRAFAAAGGRVMEGEDLAAVPRTLDVRMLDPGSRDIRVLKRVDGKRGVYFVVNEHMGPHDVTLRFPEGGRIVRYDPCADAFERVSEDGSVRRWFGAGESAIYLAGDVPDAKPQVEYEAKGMTLADGWTLRKAVSHEAGKDDLEVRACADAERPAALGDWRETLGGEFSGKAVYRTRFVAPKAGRVRLDLGTVCWCASVRLDGRNLDPRFFGPYRWELDLAAGSHDLEVTVANLLVNQLGSDRIRKRLVAEDKPHPSYEHYQSVFDRENHESGLYGPVTLSYAVER